MAANIGYDVVMTGVYSLVNIATMVRDLARRPAGATLATDLLHVLDLEATSLRELDRHAPAPDAPRHRAALATVVATEVPALHLLSEVRRASERGGLATWTASVDLLEAAPVGGGEELLRWVADELLAAAWQREGDLAVARHPQALAVVTDAVLAAWVDGPGLPEAQRASVPALRQPWERWCAQHSCPPPADAALAEIPAAIARAPAAAFTAAAADLRALRGRGWSWPAAMHDACWAIELTGRGHDAARAQLAALAALLPITGAPLLHPDVVAAVTAAVHATAVADVLPAGVVADMTTPLLSHLT